MTKCADCKLQVKKWVFFHSDVWFAVREKGWGDFMPSWVWNKIKLKFNPMVCLAFNAKLIRTNWWSLYKLEETFASFCRTEVFTNLPSHRANTGPCGRVLCLLAFKWDVTKKNCIQEQYNVEKPLLITGTY